jgi:hypothetical protein
MFIARAASLVALLVLLGCAAVVTTDNEHLRLGSTEFRGYFEKVFREQNRLADGLAFALEASSPSADLVAAEQALLVACAGVNELATARRDARRIGIHRSAALARSVVECEGATRRAAAALAAARS